MCKKSEKFKGISQIIIVEAEMEHYWHHYGLLWLSYLNKICKRLENHTFHKNQARRHKERIFGFVAHF